MTQACCNIIKFAVIFQRQPYKDQCIYILCRFRNSDKLGFCFFQECLLPKKISAGISCDAEFRENHNLCALLFHFFCHFNDFVCIKFAVCHLNFRSSRSYFNKSVFHFIPPCRLKPISLFTFSENFFKFFHVKYVVSVTEMTVQFHIFALLYQFI